MGALLGEERDQLTDLGVVDRVLQRVRRGRIGLAHVQPQVEHQALADLALGLAHAVVGVQRQSGDFDRDRLGATVGILVVALLVQLILAVVIVAADAIVVVEVLGQLFPVGSVVVAGVGSSRLRAGVESVIARPT